MTSTDWTNDDVGDDHSVSPTISLEEAKRMISNAGKLECDYFADFMQPTDVVTCASCEARLNGWAVWRRHRSGRKHRVRAIGGASGFLVHRMVADDIMIQLTPDELLLR